MPGERAHGKSNPVSGKAFSSVVARPSWCVTALAAIHVVLGAIWVVFVGFLMLLLALIGIGKGANVYEVLLVSLGMLFVVVIPGLVLAFLGYGLFRRRRWSRTGALILGVLSVLSAVQGVVRAFWAGEFELMVIAAIPGGYALLVFSILLHKRYGAEFTGKGGGGAA